MTKSNEEMLREFELRMEQGIKKILLDYYKMSFLGEPMIHLLRII